MSDMYKLNEYVYCVPFTYNGDEYRVCIDISHNNIFIQLIINDSIIDIDMNDFMSVLYNEREYSSIIDMLNNSLYS